MKVAISGSSGLIGTALAADLTAAGHQVIRLVRRGQPAAGDVAWDPQAPGGGLSAAARAALDGLDAAVSLSGAAIFGRPWTKARKQVLRSSRIQATAALAGALAAASRPPRVLLSASAVGWYGDTGDREVDEAAPAGTGFLSDLVADWEAAPQPARQAGIRVVTMRSGIVLSRSGGMLRPLTLAFSLGLGARFGPGTQYVSWISVADHVAAMRYLIDTPGIDGPVNLTAPAPVTNAVLTAELARAVHRPAVLRFPAPLLRTVLAEASVELLASHRVAPRRLLEAGFTFAHPGITAALSAVL